MEKNIYRTDSENQTYKLIVGRIALMIAIISAAWNFSENPIGISIILFILITLILFSGNENIVVYKDRFTYNYSSIIKLFKKQSFYYKDIEDISYEGVFGFGLDKITDKLSIPDPDNTIEIIFLNKDSKIIRTSIYKSELKNAIGIIYIQMSKYKRNSMDSADN